jgi:hypothetical protein
MRTLLMALLALSLAPSVGLAGGGSKQVGTIKVTNNGSDMLAVIVDPSSNVQASLNGGTLDAQTFFSAGGQLIGPRGVAVFGGKRTGAHTVVAAYVSGASSGSTVSEVSTQSVNVSKGKTVNVSANGSVASGVTLQ